MLVGDRDAGQHRTNDSKEALVRAAEKQVSEMGCSIYKLFGSAVDAAV